MDEMKMKGHFSVQYSDITLADLCQTVVKTTKGLGHTFPHRRRA
jgi:hypothetical protein